MVVNSAKLNQVLTIEQINIIGEILTSHNLCIDSRKVQYGDIFCAFPGAIVDGRDFIKQAINAGASLILYEAGSELILTIPSISIKNLASYIGVLVANSLDNPTKKLYTIAVTGTNGKTSICHWLNQVYSLLANKTAIIGTTGCGIYPQLDDYASTTPDPILLQQLFNKFVQQKVDLVAMEVSSHALIQGRVNGTQFNQAIFTNLTQDHLDYHKTMEEYYQAKKTLFLWENLDSIIINTDNDYGKRLYDELPQTCAKLSYGINKIASLMAKNIVTHLSGTEFNLCYNDEQLLVKTQIIGEFNVSNLLAVGSSLLMRGINLKEVAQLLLQLKPVIGRMETIKLTTGPLVVIDFAHTPDALSNVLTTLNSITNRGKLYCIFGCGGNRDKTKRSIMGKIATSLADIVIITSDNPRFENPLDIIADILLGIVTNSNTTIIVDRKDAITSTIEKAKDGDIILIAGKGHENYQEINGIKYHFSDQEIVISLNNKQILK